MKSSKTVVLLGITKGSTMSEKWGPPLSLSLLPLCSFLALPTKARILYLDSL